MTSVSSSVVATEVLTLAMSSRSTPPSLSTTTRNTRLLPAGVTTTSSRSNPRAVTTGSRVRSRLSRSEAPLMSVPSFALCCCGPAGSTIPVASEDSHLANMGGWPAMTAAWGDEPSRRSVLAGGGLLLVSACTGSTAPGPPGLSADQRLARRVAAQIKGLAAVYALTIAAHPNLRPSLAPLAAEHEAHAAALVALPPLPTSTPASTSSPSASDPSTNPSSGTSSAPTIPATPGAAREALAALERAAAAQRRHQAGAPGPELARLLASIAACEAVHATLVTQ